MRHAPWVVDGIQDGLDTRRDIDTEAVEHGPVVVRMVELPLRHTRAPHEGVADAEPRRGWSGHHDRDGRDGLVDQTVDGERGVGGDVMLDVREGAARDRRSRCLAGRVDDHVQPAPHTSEQARVDHA